MVDVFIVKCWIFGFVFYYLFFMLYFWMIGGLLYYFLFECGMQNVWYLLVFFGVKSYFKVLIIVFCYNEEVNVCEVISYFVCMWYLNYDIIVVNDGSFDCIGE